MPTVISGTTGVSQVQDNVITTNKILNNTVTTEKIAPGAVITEDLANGAVTAAKMSGGQSGSAPIYGCRAWVNFSGPDTLYSVTPENLSNTVTITVTAGNDFGFWTNSSGTYTTSTSYLLGVKYWLPVLNGVAGGLLGGADVSSPTNAIQFTEIISPTQLKFRFTNNQIPLTDATVTGNNTANFRFQSYGIRESGNVAAVFRASDGTYSTGVYNIVFNTPLPNRFYTVYGSGSWSFPNPTFIQISPGTVTNMTTVSCQIRCGYDTGGGFGTIPLYHPDFVGVSFLC
jgi:hypothetical protein